VVAAPVPVTNANANGCGNHSTALLPAADGNSILELATATDANNLCVSYLAAESWNQLPTEGTYYDFQNVYASLCLDDYKGGTANGTTADLSTCKDSNGVYDEYWQVHSQGNGYFTIQSETTGLCLDNNGGSATPGNKVVLWTCTGANPNQNWRFIDVGLNQYELQNQAAGMPLDDSGGSKTVGNPLDIWTDLGLATQHWILH
jgi:Ricin-type beta-trefoil lectin domain-like